MKGDWWFVVVVKGGERRLGRNYYLLRGEGGELLPLNGGTITLSSLLFISNLHHSPLFSS
ncbi:hypothetical protein KSS87_001789, partial [Heliosperma pusillum]